MSGVNKAILIGHLGKDPDVRKTPNGTSVATFSLATSERYTDRNGERQDKTEWHNVVLWGKLADLAGQYLAKGRNVYIEGRITTRSWDDRDGNKRYTTEIVGNTMQFLGGGTNNGGMPNGGNNNSMAGQQAYSPNQMYQPQQQNTQNFAQQPMPVNPMAQHGSEQQVQGGGTMATPQPAPTPSAPKPAAAPVAPPSDPIVEDDLPF